MAAWTDVTLAYAIYLAAVAHLGRRFAAARRPASAALALALALWLWFPALGGASPAAQAIAWVITPGLALLGTYRLSGAFFLRPSPDLERRLLSVDEAVLGRTGVLAAYRSAPAFVRETFELCYLLVYVTLPAGATVLLIGGHPDALGAYWATVFLAEVSCYAVLPWLQSRPPRAIEPPRSSSGTARQLNSWLLRHGSIQANTFPSAHAAGAIATALAVSSVMPSAGAVFAVIAVGITLATVLGRYHYALDSIAGVAVGVASWILAKTG
jgi:membrane-associated phospholipid phosphatase